MASINPAPAQAVHDSRPVDEKKERTDAPVDENRIERVDTAGEDIFENEKGSRDNVDEFGAHAKTDPKEIALVKKLDRFIIVS